MNRNVESHFAEAPHVTDVQRSIFDMSATHKTSFNVGEIVPFLCREILPGDTVKMSTSKVVRLQTLLTPIMDNMYLDTYYFFVPNRLVWDHWVNFCGESDQAWLPSVEYSVPQLVVPESGFPVGSLADHLGINPNVKSTPSYTFKVSALPFRGYAKIMDDWFRDENLTDPLVISHGDADTFVIDDAEHKSRDIFCSNGWQCFHAAKYHDRYTSALPAPQFSATPVSVPLGNAGFAPVSTLLDSHDPFYHKAVPEHLGPIVYESATVPIKYDLISSSDAADLYQFDPTSQTDVYKGHGFGSTYTNIVSSIRNSTSTAFSSGAHKVETLDQNEMTSFGSYLPNNLYADVGSLGNITINSLRLAFQTQRFLERQALSGHRYIEVLKGQFGVTSPDARLQRSEYLGGNRVPISIHEVVNNAESEQAFLGNLGATSSTGDYNEDFIKSFTEHGYLFGVMVARYDHTYSQGVPKHFLRRDKFDFYWPVFSQIGEQPIEKVELFYNPATNSDVFGYTEAWSEYRFAESTCSGEMRPDVSNSLASWHLADHYASAPFLSDSWIREDLSNVDRVLSVSHTNANQLFADIYCDCQMTRIMPMYSIPGLIDHH